MQSEEIRSRFLKFFEKRGHAVIPSASLVPENDSSVLFTTAGMQPLVPYLMGGEHPAGRRLVNVQKCVRTQDIDEVGDRTHDTFFEMLGNWSLGDPASPDGIGQGYFKEDAIKWSYELLTSKEEGFGLDKNRIYVTCFEGDSDAPKDEESAEIWRSLGIPESSIYFLGKDDNWWSPGPNGPCGPDTEMFYDIVGNLNITTKEDFIKANSEQKVVEIWNDVFMEYEKKRRVILADGMYCLYDGDFMIDEGMLNILENINARKILAINNFKKKSESLLKDKGYEVFSFDGKIKKDNEKFFLELCEFYHLDKESILYFDHKEENIGAAKKAGIKNVLLFDGNLAKLKDFLEKNIYYFSPLKQKNVDTGMGVERTLTVLNGLDDNYLTDCFKPIVEKVGKIAVKKYFGNEKEMRIIADHIRAAVFILGDERGIKPSNLGQGYILRRLIRRAVRYGRMLGIRGRRFTKDVAEVVIEIYSDYGGLRERRDFILKELEEEEAKFAGSLEKGLNKFAEIVKSTTGDISGKDAFLLFQSYGFPIEMTEELAEDIGRKVELEEYEEELEKHQQLSRTASAGIFKSGLADDSEMTVRLHTATHLLNEALRKVLGGDVRQRGSNITPERLRFDFNLDRKLSEEERKKVENLVNKKIKAGLDVVREELALDDAFSSGAQGEFGAKYPEVVSVYTVLDSDEKRGWFSKEICTGPHVRNTKEIGKFRILKEESVSAGVRRIKAAVG